MCFVDTVYLPGFKVLVESLKKHSPMLSQLPLVVYSDELQVIKDPEVKERSALQYLIPEEDIELLKEVPSAGARTAKSYRTFMKFIAFKDFGFIHHIFLDSDLLCMNTADRIIPLSETADYTAARAIPIQELRNEKKKLLPPGSGLEFKHRWFGEKSPKRAYFNSGVSVIGPRLIGSSFYREIIEYAKKQPFNHDQDCLNHFFKQNREFKINMLPQWFNVTKPSYQVFGEEEFNKDQDKIIFHHYTGKKPWEDGWDSDFFGKEKNSTFLNRAWHEVIR